MATAPQKKQVKQPKQKKSAQSRPPAQAATTQPQQPRRRRRAPGGAATRPNQPRPAARAKIASAPLALKNARGELQKMIMDPANAQAIVIGSVRPARSSCTKSVSDIDFTTNVDTGVTPLCEDGSAFVILTRNPFWNRLEYVPNPSGYVVVYDWVFDGNSSSMGWNFSASGGTNIMSQVYNLNVTRMDADSGNNLNPHGSHMFTMQRAGRDFFWIDATTAASAEVGVKVSLTSGTDNVLGSQLVAFRLIDDVDEPVEYAISTMEPVRDAPDDAVNFVHIAVRGYFCFEIRIAQQSGNSGNFTGTFNSAYVNYGYTGGGNLGTDFVGHRMASGIDTMYDSIGSVRITSGSILVSNIAPALYQNGDLILAQLPSGRGWDSVISGANSRGLLEYLTTSMISSDYSVVNWETGGYTYLLPESPDVLLKDQVTLNCTSSDALSTVAGSPYTSSDYLLCYIRTRNPATTPASIARITVATTVQVVTKSPLFGGTPEAFSPMYVTNVVYSLRKAPHFFNNFAHLAAIAGFIKNAAQAANVVSDLVTGIGSTVREVRSWF